ncbi:MAG: alpha/beta hydrolase [Burkholderiales bacterium]|nr:alpha/beta hydrolase [Flavobacterium sp.]
MSKIPVYFMPGLAASSAIFERIKLPTAVFEMYFLEWQIPHKNEELHLYAQRMAEFVKHKNPVLVGVSFGGVLVQEMAQFLDLRKLIIISSVKTNAEVPLRMKIAKTTKAYKLVPTTLLQNIEILNKFSFGSMIQQRLKLYEKYLSVRNKVYLEWAIKQMVVWNRTEVDKNVTHIHGDADEVFPIKNVKNCITVKGGTHIMIISKFKWINENLPKIILGEYP